jgi:Protein HRI1
MIPDEFVGAWRRVSIAIDDEPPQEDSDVVWLQARSGFADLRMPRADSVDPMAFAGVTTWEPPSLTWHHNISLEPPWTDVGAVHWRGDDLVERGATTVDGEPATYEEVWRCVSNGRGVPMVVLTHDDDGGTIDSTLVRVGDHALVMGSTPRGFTARRDELVDGGWVTTAVLGSGMLPHVPVDRPDWRPGQLVELCGTPWRVRELE